MNTSKLAFVRLASKPAHVIKAAARHADITTFMRYVHLSNRHLKAELEDAFDSAE